MMSRVLSAALVLFVLAGQSMAAEAKYTLSGENTKIVFIGHKPDGKHEGGFKTLTGSALIDGTDIATLKISVEIDMNSTFSDDDKLTAHLKSPDFFSVKANPKSKFISTRIEKADGGYSVTGKLTLNGKTKELTFPAKIEVADGSLKLTGDFKIDRNNWGISFGKGKINDEVNIGLSLNAKK